MLRCLLLSSLLLFLNACNTNSGQINTSLTLCCPGNYVAYSNYGLETQNIPMFLREYLISEFDAAFQEKGLARNDRSNDIQVVLTYNHVNLRSDQEEIDPFVRVETMTTELNYAATIDISIIDRTNDEKVWGGSISRIHQVVPGEYMHEDRARVEFRQAFRSVLASYPTLISDES